MLLAKRNFLKVCLFCSLLLLTPALSCIAGNVVLSTQEHFSFEIGTQSMVSLVAAPKNKYKKGKGKTLSKLNKKNSPKGNKKGADCPRLH